MLNWGLLRGHIVIPKATSLKNQMENIDIYDFELSEEEIDEINLLNKNIRLINKLPYMKGYDFFV